MNYYNEIKTELINNEINKQIKQYSINRIDLNTYYKVGKILSEAGKHYGENIIGSYAKKLKLELNKKYNERSLRRYRQFYNFVVSLNWSAMPTNLSWSHIIELMTLSDKNEINYYINIIREKNIGYRELNKLIKNHDYDRLSKKAKNKINLNKIISIEDFVKNPIIIKNNKYQVLSEKVLKKIILEDIESFLEELGIGYSFIKSEYPIKIGNNYNYIDILLYNIKYKCYVVVELKITELKKEHIGQIQIYMNYIDDNVKDIYDNKTIGIIICKHNNDFIVKYCSDEKIISREYLVL